MYLSMSTYANPVADQWYRTITPSKRLFLKTEYESMTGMTWEQAGVFFSMRERIAVFHTKLVAGGVIRPCGYRPI